MPRGNRADRGADRGDIAEPAALDRKPAAGDDKLTPTTTAKDRTLGIRILAKLRRKAAAWFPEGKSRA